MNVTGARFAHPPYEAHVEQGQSWIGGPVSIWLYYHAGDQGVMVLEHEAGDRWSHRLVPPGGDIGEPTLCLPSSAIAALGAAAAEMHPPDRAQAAHLADAVKVRDRLLTIIEREERTP